MPEGENVWEWFGFKRNPYDFQALSVSRQDRRLFVGRDKELPRLASPITSDPGGMTVVEGRVGVGKTSFVNVVQYDYWQKRLCLPSFQVLQIQANTDPIGFLLSAFSTCIGSLELSNPGAADKDKDLKAGKAMVTQMLNSGWTFSGGLSVGLLGAQAGGGKAAAPSSPLLPALPGILTTSTRWFEAAKRLGWPKFVIPVNNLDMLDDDSAVRFLNVVRDYMITFAKAGVWWVLIAKEGFVRTMENRAHRVSEVFTGPPIQVGPLSLDEINRAIDVRVETYTTGARQGPATPEVVSWLYELSGGEVRAIFKKITDLIYEYHATVPSAKDLPVEAARSILVAEARRRISELDLQPNYLGILEKSFKKGTIRLSEYNEYGFKSEPAISYAVQKLAGYNLLRRTEKGREVTYIPATDTNLAFQKLEPKPVRA